jgi:transketolase
MAIAERFLGERFNRHGFNVIDHHTWAMASDGDMMEGVASEASSLAGHLKLGKLILLYDDNKITIDGGTELTFTEDVTARYRAYGWHTQDVDDVNDLSAVSAALQSAVEERERPSLIRVRSHIGWGSPHLQDTSKAHGGSLDAEEVRLTKLAYGLEPDEQFDISSGVYDLWRSGAKQGVAQNAAWRSLVESYRLIYPDLAADLDSSMTSLPSAWDSGIRELSDQLAKLQEPTATRAPSSSAVTHIGRRVWSLLGGTGDLAHHCGAYMEGAGTFGQQPAGRNIHYGVREHAMGAISNGLALHGLRPFAGTFLVFSDYMRPSIRLAALMKLPVIYVFSHDSLGVGGDGPTHQSVEHLAALRAIPRLNVIRPADGPEAVEAWRAAVSRLDGPTAIVLSRQNLPPIRSEYDDLRSAEGLRSGAYVLAEAAGVPELIIIATGSEVWLALSARKTLQAEGIPTRVVSMPSWELFEAQDPEYRESILPSSVSARLAVEANSPLGWSRWVGSVGEVLAVTDFGVCSPDLEALEERGFTTDNVINVARRLVTRVKSLNGHSADSQSAESQHRRRLTHGDR